MDRVKQEAIETLGWLASEHERKGNQSKAEACRELARRAESAPYPHELVLCAPALS